MRLRGFPCNHPVPETATIQQEDGDAGRHGEIGVQGSESVRHSFPPVFLHFHYDGLPTVQHQYDFLQQSGWLVRSHVRVLLGKLRFPGHAGCAAGVGPYLLLPVHRCHLHWHDEHLPHHHRRRVHHREGGVGQQSE